MTTTTDFERASLSGQHLAQALSFEALRALGWDDGLLAHLLEGIEDLVVAPADDDEEQMTLHVDWLSPVEAEVPASFHEHLENDERALSLVLWAFANRRDEIIA
ncbi:MAG: hypothetical protein GY822_22950 [Deltaproteobacteria bacterium]|nr:hypothetical protein [Deltaproteobacteria bacterium]